MLFDGIVLVIDVPLQTLHVRLDVVHFVLDQLELGFRLESHVVDLALVLLVLVVDLLQLLVPILLDLANGHLVPLDQLLVVLLLLVDLRLLVLHLFFMPFFLVQNFILMILLDLLDGSEEVLVLALLLRLQLGELFGVVKHSSTVLVSLLLDFVLLLIQELSPFDLLSVLRFLNLPQKRLFLVQSLLLLALKLIFLLSDGALLRLNIQLDVNFHIGIFLILSLLLQLLLFIDQFIDLALLREDLLAELELALDALRVSLRVTVLHIEDCKHAVHAHREKMRVGVRDSQACDGRGMRLDLGTLLEGKLPDLNGARVWHLTLLTDAREQNLARVMDHELRNVMLELGQLGHWVRPIVVDVPRNGLQFVGLSVDDLLVTDCNETVVFARDVDD